MIIEEIRNIKSTKKDLRNFGLVVGGVLLAIGLYLWWSSRADHQPVMIAGGVLVISGLLVPRLLLPFQKVWMAFAVVMGWVMTRVILTVLFFVAVAPLGLLAKLVGKPFLDLGIDESRQSYWRQRAGKETSPGDYEKQY